MIPKLAVWARWIIPEIDVIKKAIYGIRSMGIGTRNGGIAEITELTDIARAAEGTRDSHLGSLSAD
jgi:hypothetical protein